MGHVADRDLVLPAHLAAQIEHHQEPIIEPREIEIVRHLIEHRTLGDGKQQLDLVGRSAGQRGQIARGGAFELAQDDGVRTLEIGLLAGGLQVDPRGAIPPDAFR